MIVNGCGGSAGGLCKRTAEPQNIEPQNSRSKRLGAGWKSGGNCLCQSLLWEQSPDRE